MCVSCMRVYQNVWAGERERDRAEEGGRGGPTQRIEGVNLS